MLAAPSLFLVQGDDGDGPAQVHDSNRLYINRQVARVGHPSYTLIPLYTYSTVLPHVLSSLPHAVALQQRLDLLRGRVRRP